MAYGIPYLGSKSIYAKLICEALPSGKRLVDLFAGGCAITDCALKKFANKWESFLVNDIAHEPLDLYSKCLRGENPVSYDWVSRDDFKSKDWATRLVWSFGNNTRSYIYGKQIEPIKHDIEAWIVDGVALNNSSILCDIDLPKLNSMKERYDWWRSYRKTLLKSRGLRLEQQRLENLERLERRENLERLERLEFSHLSYERYEYQKGDVVYCDIPYKNTNCKQYKDSGFNHELFWQWAKSQPFDVYVSERIIPQDVEIILTKEVLNRANTKGTDGFKREYLVRV